LVQEGLAGGISRAGKKGSWLLNAGSDGSIDIDGSKSGRGGWQHRVLRRRRVV
jgi:hypothetical protein